MGRLYARTRLINLNLNQPNLTYAELRRKLKDEDDIEVSRQSIGKFLRRYRETGQIVDLHAGGRPPILRREHFDDIDAKIEENNELSALELRDILRKEFNIQVSRETVQRVRRRLGWSFQKTHYCQLISEKNCKEGLQFCLKMLRENERFENVIFSDETKIQMESTILRQARKATNKRYERLKPKPKHPYSVGDVSF